MTDESLKRAKREEQIRTLIQEQFDDIAPTDEEIMAVEAEALKDHRLAMEWLTLTNKAKSSVNTLYMSIQVLNLRSHRERKGKPPDTSRKPQ